MCIFDAVAANNIHNYSLHLIGFLNQLFCWFYSFIIFKTIYLKNICLGRVAVQSFRCTCLSRVSA